MVLLHNDGSREKLILFRRKEGGIFLMRGFLMPGKSAVVGAVSQVLVFGICLSMTCIVFSDSVLMQQP
jgi:hypothetical protein